MAFGSLLAASSGNAGGTGSSSAGGSNVWSGFLCCCSLCKGYKVDWSMPCVGIDCEELMEKLQKAERDYDDDMLTRLVGAGLIGVFTALLCILSGVGAIISAIVGLVAGILSAIGVDIGSNILASRFLTESDEACLSCIAKCLEGIQGAWENILIDVGAAVVTGLLAFVNSALGYLGLSLGMGWTFSNWGKTNPFPDWNRDPRKRYRDQYHIM